MRYLLKINILLILSLCLVLPNYAQKKNKKKKKKNNVEEIFTNDKKALSKQDKQKAEAYIVEGMKYYFQEKYQQALTNFKKALEFDSESASIYYQIGDTYLQLDDLSLAQLNAEKALEMNKKNKYFHLLLVEILIARRDYDNIANTYQALIDNIPNSEKFYEDVAQIEVRNGNFEKAIKAYNALEKAKGVDEFVSQQKQDLYLQLNQPEKAIEEAQKLANAVASSKNILSLAEILIKNNRMDEAMPLLEKVSDDVENASAETQLLLADIYRRKGEEEKSIKYLKGAFKSTDISANQKVTLVLQLIQGESNSTLKKHLPEIVEVISEIHPNNAKVNLLKGDIYAQDKKLKEAKDAYQKALTIDGSDAKVWQNLLSLNLQLGNYADLAKQSDDALSNFPNQAVFWFYNGLANTRLKDYEKAVFAFEEGQRLAFDNQELESNCWIGLGDVYNAQKKYEKSDEAYEKALEIVPENTQALNNYAYFLALRKDKLGKAEELAKRLIDKYPNNATFLDTYAWVLYNDKKYKNAKTYLEKAVNNGGGGTVYEHYGDVLFKLGEKSEALKQWQKAKEKGGVSELIDKKIKEQKLYE